MSCAAAILAGGKATRMGGRAKSFLLVDGERVIDRQLHVLRPLFSEILVVANDRAPFEEFGLPVFADVVAGDFGPLAGILTALESARADRVVCVACDMPFLDAATLELVRDHAPDAEVVVPLAGGREEPLLARYARAVAPAIRAQLASGDYKVSRFFAAVRTERITLPDERCLTNVNTPDELTSLPRPPRR